MTKTPAVKIIALIRKRADISSDDFIKYYEERHVPLVLKHSPMICDYRRNYVRKGAPRDGKMHSTDVDYDVITEAWFATKEDFAAWRAGAANNKALEEIAADEQNFMDRGSVRMFVVDERSSRR